MFSLLSKQKVWSKLLQQRCEVFAVLYLTIIPRAHIGYESIAHEAKGQMGYWLRGYEGERNNCFSKIQLVGQKKISRQVKAKHQSFFTTKTLQI